MTGGAIRGVARGAGALFAGVPYARPPVGALRWQPPQPVEAWTGVREAGEPGPSALQPDLGWNTTQRKNQSEDCLYLNVLTGEWPVKSKRPVIVYIHGGANVGGAGWDHLLIHTTLPEHGVVLVSLNYRLGVFGFFSHPGLSADSPHHASGNYGLLDQMAALRWVRDNIATFGGDPENVTVMGQSAGAQDIGLLMVSPRARGLFQRAILESGPVVSIGAFGYPSRAEVEKKGDEFGRAIGGATLAALRALPADKLIADAAERRLGTGPSIDGWLLKEEPGATFAAGRAAAIPLVVGSNAREFAFHGTRDELRAQIERDFGGLAPKALKLYGLAEGMPAMAMDPMLGDTGTQFLTDAVFRGSASLLAIWQSAAGRPVWQYQFSRTPIGHESEGAAHSAELPYVFGEMVPNGLGADYNAADKALCEAMQRYWVNFAASGDPNHSEMRPEMRGGGTPPPLTAWPRYEPEERGYIEFLADGPRAKAGLRRAFVDLYRERYEELHPQ
ncbi:MAG TPA: carboxylesterase family protein [Opitutus sp.]|nr:carboxylesterase family protein [Opitutus sp.]